VPLAAWCSPPRRLSRRAWSATSTDASFRSAARRRRTARIEQLHELFTQAGLDAPIRADIRDEIWLKLWGNLCFNPISALTLATVDTVATDPETRAVCRAMMLEAKAIGDRIGLRLRVDAERRIDGAAALGPHKMSMLQDLERGRSLEIEPLVGVVQTGRRSNCRRRRSTVSRLSASAKRRAIHALITPHIHRQRVDQCLPLPISASPPAHAQPPTPTSP
jgi:ketopantoate reductase